MWRQKRLEVKGISNRLLSDSEGFRIQWFTAGPAGPTGPTEHRHLAEGPTRVISNVTQK